MPFFLGVMRDTITKGLAGALCTLLGSVKFFATGTRKEGRQKEEEEEKSPKVQTRTTTSTTQRENKK
jgi:hypothetical protein